VAGADQAPARLLSGNLGGIAKMRLAHQGRAEGFTALIMVMVAMLGIYIYVIDTVFYQVFFHK
jgi:hypothetical protein